MKNILIYDTTLRDGNQSEELNLSLEDKIKIALKLDYLGVQYIEGGWPGASPVDTAFFQEIKKHSLKHATITAFGSTYHTNHTAETDPNLAALVESGAGAVAIVGKSCIQHVREALGMKSAAYLPVVAGSVAFLAARMPEVLFDAEHFFDGFLRNKEYSLSVLKAAFEAGAKKLVLCDTNGGILPDAFRDIVLEVRKALPDAVIGVHAHNDCDMGVANSIAAVQAGATMVQGTINGIGERCGNANLCSVIPILELKYPEQGFRCLPKGKLPHLREVSTYITEVANMMQLNRQPFVGRSAFAHKGGIHVSAVAKNSALYEHMSPALVGNEQRILLTELAGRSNIVSMAKRFGFELDKNDPQVKDLLTDLKKKASLGYDYAAAEASVELLLLRTLGTRRNYNFFDLVQFRVLEMKKAGDGVPTSEATISLKVKGIAEHTAAFGQGPVNALDSALRKALCTFYPRIAEMRLVDFKVRVLAANENSSGTASLVRVLIESADLTHKWVTVGVSFNIIEASWQALIDSVTYKLYKDSKEKKRKKKTALPS